MRTLVGSMARNPAGRFPETVVNTNSYASLTGKLGCGCLAVVHVGSFARMPTGETFLILSEDDELPYARKP